MAGMNYNQIEYDDDGGGNDSQQMAIPTIEELEISLSTSDVFTRKSLTRSVLDTFRTVVSSALNEKQENEPADLSEFSRILPIIQRLAEDQEYLVRYCMVEQMPHLSMFFSEFREQLGHLTQKFVLPLLVSTLNDANSQVRKTCHAALLVLVEQNLVDNDDVDKLVCPAILHITESSSAEDQRSEAVTLLCRIAPLLGREITLKHFLEEYKSLCSDSLMQVRKICAASFGEICTVVGPEIVEKELLPHFEHMCNDDLWGVRKACAEVFTIVAGCVRRTTRWEPLSPVYVNLLRDESRWVRLAAYQNLGQFIATFIGQKGEEETGAPEENKSLLDHTPDIARQAEPAVPDLVSELVGQKAKPSEPEKIAETDLNSQPNPGSSESGRTVDLNELFSKLVISQTDSVVSPTRYLFCEEMSNGQLMWREPIAELEVDKVLELAEMNPAENHDVLELAEMNPAENPDVLQLAEMNPAENPDDFIPIGDRDIFNNSNLTPLSASPLPPQPPYTPKSLLGPSQNVVPQDLLDHYLWMVDPSHSESGDTEMARYCAYTLPGVTLTLGKDHWEYLKDLYKTLEGDMQWKVRKTLASSLHELGAILGDDVVNSDLVQSFVWFFKDLDEVRIGALQHLGEFFKLLDPTRRKFVLPKLREFLRLDNERNWRFRLELSEQLVAIISSCDQNDISDHIYPLAMMLIKDKVATVRLSAFKVLSSVIKATHPDLRTITLIDIINETAISQKWYLRQSYPKICEELLDAEAVELEQFCEYLLHPALCLRWDAVPNVRIALAQLAATKLLPNPFFEGPANRFREELTETLNTLQADEDRDVRFYFDKKEEPSSVTPKPDEVQEAVDP